MRFESDYTKEEIRLALQERTQPYSFFNMHLPESMLSKYKNGRFVLWKTKSADSFCVTKLENAFYGKISTENGKTVIKGHFRLGNSDIISWLVVFILYLSVVFAATLGTVAERLLNMGVMSLVWCTICAAAIAIENLCDRRQKRAVLQFIRDELLVRNTYQQVEEGQNE